MTDLQVFPVRKNWNEAKSKWEKSPAIPKGKDWHSYQANADEFKRVSNVGIVIPQGRVVIDIDTQKGVTRSDVEKALGCALDWDNAILQKTVSGGQHYCFLLPDDIIVKQGTDLLGVQGFDTRTSGNGWIASGDGYEDLTFIGLPQAMIEEDFPMLPIEAIQKLNAPSLVSKDDFEMMVINQPLGLSDDELTQYMGSLSDDRADGDDWLKVMFALYHETNGSEFGWQLFDKFSQRNQEKYDERNNRARWDSVGRNKKAKPITFKSVIDMTKVDARYNEPIQQDAFLALAEKASRVETLDAYNLLKEEVQKINTVSMPDDMRGMIATELYNAFGKDKGMTKSDIKKGLLPLRKPKRNRAEDSTPFWLDGWVYIEMTCEFANTVLNYAIKREAFNAKFDRMPECMLAEKSAAVMALNDYQIPTVVDKMFWPGADMIFEHDGKQMLNAYYVSGVEPCEFIDDDGQSVIDTVLSHVDFTLSDKREQGILLDWIAYVVQNPGKRINWAMLLQGAQGTGKSYFVKMMQLIIGEHVRNLDPTAIAGRFTGWAHGSRVVAVEEIRISGTNKYEVLDRMKPFITNDTVQIEEKGRDHRTVPNFTSYLLLTNHKDAIPLTSGDRRYCVLFSRVQTEEQLFKELGGEKGAENYFNNLFEETKRRSDALARYFLDRKISAEFSPQGRAPETKARQMMMQISTSPERSQVEDAISNYECDVIGENILDVTWLNKMVSAEAEDLPKTRTLSAVLLEMGYEQIPGRRVKLARGLGVQYVWFKPAHCAPDEVVKIVKRFHENGGVPF